LAFLHTCKCRSQGVHEKIPAIILMGSWQKGSENLKH
jgi:hypothetical protein